MKTDERIADRCIADVLEVYKVSGYWSWMCSHGVESWELCDCSEYYPSLSHQEALNQALLHLKYRHPDLWDKARGVATWNRAFGGTQEADSHKSW